MLAVASPDYWSRHDEPSVPADLHRHQCINWRFPGSGDVYRWEFEKGGQKVEMSVRGSLISNHQEVALQAALEGLGIVYTHDDRIAGWIREGRLKRVLAGWSPRFPGLFLYYSNKRHAPSALRAFLDCLLDRGAFAAKPVKRSRDEALRPGRSKDHRKLRRRS